MNETLKELGATLKAKRKDLSLSIKEVENATSIRSHYLIAIEEGHVKQFPSPFYMRGFFRQYATFLGLDPEVIMQEHPEFFDISSEKPDFSYGIGTLEMRSNPGEKSKKSSHFMWGVFTVIVLLLAYYFAKYLGLL